MRYRQIQDGQLLRFVDEQARTFACCVSMRLVESRHEKREVAVSVRERRRQLATPEIEWRRAA